MPRTPAVAGNRPVVRLIRHVKLYNGTDFSVVRLKGIDSGSQIREHMLNSLGIAQSDHGSFAVYPSRHDMTPGESRELGEVEDHDLLLKYRGHPSSGLFYYVELRSEPFIHEPRTPHSFLYTPMHLEAKDDQTLAFTVHFKADDGTFNGEAVRRVHSLSLPIAPQKSMMALDASTVAAMEADVSGSYLSAEYTDAVPLDGHKTLLIIRLQCHPRPGRRFGSAIISLDFGPSAPPSGHALPSSPSPSSSSSAPISNVSLVKHAPRRSHATVTQEHRSMRWSVGLPPELLSATEFNLVASSAMRGVTGVQPSITEGSYKAVDHAMTIIGSARGMPVRTGAEWSLEENASNKSGIPSEFQPAAVVQHDGPFIAGLNVRGRLRGGLLEQRISSKGLSVRLIDIEKWNTRNRPWRGDEGWELFMDRMTGAVPGAVVEFGQALIRP